MTKKIFAMFLAVLMVVSMLPTASFAEDNETAVCPGETLEHTKYNCTEDVSKQKVVAPTCTEWGYTLRYCSVCGKGFATDPTEPLQHELKQIEGEKAPTCTEGGYGSKWGCTRCDYTETRDETDALDHDWKQVSVADCEKGGKHTYECTRCGATKEEDVKPGEHKWGEWILSKKATAEEDGEAYRECEACGAKQTVNVYYHDHVFFEFGEIPATCTTAGVKGYFECRICGERYLSEEAAEEDKIESDEDLVIPAEHKWELTKTVPAACETAGYEEYTCTECGATKTEKTDDATGHAWDEGTVTTEPNCTEKGVKTFACANCDKTYTEDIDALGHTWDITEPSCKDTKHTCTVCGAEEPVTPGEHTWDDGTIIVTGNCEQTGVVVYKCTTCTATDTKNLEHDWDEGVVTLEPTCTTKGSKKFTCQRECCGATKEEEIDALGHDYGDWATAKAPTCTESGENKRVCGECGGGDSEIVAATGHEEVTVTVAATCVTYGFSYKICTNENCPVATKKTVVVDGYTYYLQDAEGNKTAVHLLSELTIDVTSGVDEHNHEEFVITEEKPTCTTDGYKIECCTACDYRKEYTAADYPEYKKTGHNFDDPDHWDILTANGCGVVGKKTVHCANKDCNVYYYEDIPANTHNYVLDEAQSTCQKQVYVCHEKNCNGTECGAVKENLGYYDDYDLHNWEIVETVYAVHTQHTYYTKLKCTLCQSEYKLDGAYITEDGEIVADENFVDEDGNPITHWEYCNSCQEHSYVFETREDAEDKHTEYLKFVTSDSAVTCEASGINRYKCPDCGYDVLVKNNEGIGHKFATAVGGGCLEEGTELLDEDGLPEDYILDSTCTAVGYHYYSGCTVEGCKYYNEKAGTFDVIPMKDHEYEQISDPCATPSFDKEENAYAACKSCGAAKYNYCNKEFEHEAENLCTDYTYLIYSCGECGKMHALYFYGNFGHDMVKIDEKAPTYTEAGYELWECRFCDHTEEKEITKLVCDHPEDSLKLIETLDPTCWKEGYNKYECRICGEEITKEIARIDHTNKDGKVIDDACDSEITDHFCTMCEKEIIDHIWEFEGHYDATCQEPGYDYSRCARCEKIGNFVWYLNEEAKNPEHEDIDKLTLVERVEPTYMEAGYELRQCPDCGQEIRYTLEKLTGLEMNMTVANANGRDGYTYGSLVELTIKLNGNDADVYGFAFDVQIPEGLSFVECKANQTSFAISTTDKDNANEVGKVNVLGMDKNFANVKISGEQLIVKLYFRVVENSAETYNFNFSNVTVSRKDAELGIVAMSYNAFGADFTTALFLDINGDGSVGVDDFFEAMDKLMNSEDSEAYYNVVLDINKDGNVDLDDMIAFRDYLQSNAKIEDLFDMGN